MKHTYIYILIDPLTNQIRYIGKANNPEQRYKNHKNRCRDKNTHKRNWINKLRLKGLYPEIEIIDRVLVSEWHYWEKFWIAYYKFLGCSLVNYTSGGDGLTFGNQTSFKKGQVSWNKGTGYKQNCLECGVEFNIPVSQSKKRLCCTRSCSTIYRKKHNIYKGTFKKNHTSWNKGKTGYSTSKKGTPLSLEVKQKISNTLKGRPSLKKRIVKQYNKEMILINTYSSILEAKLITRIKGISNALTGRVKTAGGYIWQ